MSKPVVLIPADKMGHGDDELGAKLMKAFIYSLTAVPDLPSHVILYNGGAHLSTEGAETVEDLKKLEDQGVEILTCGTCTDFFGITDKVAVGSVTNMYEIAEICTSSDNVIRP